MNEAPTTNGAYDLLGVIYHQHSPMLMKKMLEIFPKEIPIIDIGCGHNFYVSVLNLAGYNAMGVDQVDMGSKYFVGSDVTKPLIVHIEGCEKMNVISLEVGEHIPAELSSGYLDNVAGFGGDVLMSWAVVGQAGHGHINCQDNDWVIEQMAVRGYAIDRETSANLRLVVQHCHCSWLRNTLMYFRPAK